MPTENVCESINDFFFFREFIKLFGYIRPKSCRLSIDVPLAIHLIQRKAKMLICNLIADKNL